MEKNVNVLEILTQYPIGCVLYDRLIKRKVVFSGFSRLNEESLIKCICCDEQEAEPRYYNRYGVFVKEGYSTPTLVPSEVNCNWSYATENGFKNLDLLGATVGNDTVVYLKKGEDSENESIHFYVLLHIRSQKHPLGIGMKTSEFLSNAEDIRYATDVERILFKRIIDKNGWSWNESEHTIFFSGKTPTCYLSVFDKVLVRSGGEAIWRPSFFGYRSAGNEENPFVCMNGSRWEQCIPYGGNEKLLGTSDIPRILRWNSYETDETD